MGGLGDKTIQKIRTYALNHYSPKAIGISPKLELRIMIAEQMFQLYQSSRVSSTRSPNKIVAEVSARVYQHILVNAQTDPHMAEIRDICGIQEGVRRSYVELANDVMAYEILRELWGVSTRNHAKAVYEEGAYNLIEMGKRQSDPRAIKSGIDALANLHDNFKDNEEDNINTASIEIEFTSDAQIVRKDAKNFSRSEIAEMKKKYGKYLDKGSDIETMIENDKGEYEIPMTNNEEDEEDFFEKKERQIIDGKD